MISIKPEVAPHGLLDKASQVYKFSDTTGNWISGVKHELIDTGVIARNFLMAGGNADNSSEKVTEISGPFHLEYTPFSVDIRVKASTMTASVEEIEQRAKNLLELTQQKNIEREFWGGTIAKLSNTHNKNIVENKYVRNRFLASEEAVNLTPTVGTGVKPLIGQALLEEALGSQTVGYRGTIHATRGIASVLDIGKDETDDVLRTKLGTSVVAGSGYTRQGPDGSEATGTNYWMFATGPVAVVLGDIQTFHDTSSQAVNSRNNEIEVIAERPVAVVWSTKQLFGVLVDLNLI